MHEVDVAGTATKQETGFEGRRVAGGWFEEPGPYRRPTIGKTRTLMSNERRVCGTIRSGQAGDITETCLQAIADPRRTQTRPNAVS